MLNDLYSKEKFRLRLVWLMSLPTERSFESSDMLCDVYVLTIKKLISEEELNVSGSESDISIWLSKVGKMINEEVIKGNLKESME